MIEIIIKHFLTTEPIMANVIQMYATPSINNLENILDLVEKYDNGECIFCLKANSFEEYLLWNDIIDENKVFSFIVYYTNTNRLN